MRTTIITAILLLFCVACSAQTKLTNLSALTQTGNKTGCEASKAVDGNPRTYYSNEPRNYQQFNLVVNLGKTVKAIKVRINANKKGIKVYVNGNYYSTTLVSDDSFYIIVADGFSSITLQGDGTEEYMCYEVTADEYDFDATKLGFSYDKSGNCVSRKIVINISKSAPIDTTGNIYTENIGNKKIIIYPNPTRGTIAVVCEGECGDDGEYRLFDNRGNQLKQDTWIQAGTPISLDDQPLGVYILQLIQNGKAESFTIIKQ